MAVQHDDRSVPEAILLWFLQVLGAVTAILFGVFGALSWQVADDANGLSKEAIDLSKEANKKADLAQSQSDSANLVALFALCEQILEAESTYSGSLLDLCNGVQSDAETKISAMVSSIFGSIPAATSTSVTSSTTAPPPGATSTTSTSPTDGSSSGAAGPSPLALGLGLGLSSIVAFISAMTFWAAIKKRRSRQTVTAVTR